MALSQGTAAGLMVRLNVQERTGRHRGILACPHVNFVKGESKATRPLWDRGRRLPISGALDWRIGFLCIECAAIYRNVAGG